MRSGDYDSSRRFVLFLKKRLFLSEVCRRQISGGCMRWISRHMPVLLQQLFFMYLDCLPAPRMQTTGTATVALVCKPSKIRLPRCASLLLIVWFEVSMDGVSAVKDETVISGSSKIDDALIFLCRFFFVFFLSLCCPVFPVRVHFTLYGQAHFLVDLNAEGTQQYRHTELRNASANRAGDGCQEGREYPQGSSPSWRLAARLKI